MAENHSYEDALNPKTITPSERSSQMNFSTGKNPDEIVDTNEHK